MHVHELASRVAGADGQTAHRDRRQRSQDEAERIAALP